MARRPLLEAPAAARAAEVVMKSFAETDRLLADAQGLDIVGLQPGEVFDPIAVVDSQIADLTARSMGYTKARVVTVPVDATIEQVIDAVVELAPSYGFDRAGTRGFLDGAVSTVDPTKGQALRRAALEHAAARLGYAIEVKP